MIYKIFSVWDLKTEAYMQPFFSPTIGSGIRAFMDAASDTNSMLFRHPGDFQLHHVGEYDDSTGKVTDILNVALGSGDDYADEPKMEAAQ